jgi:hypothetical protein
MAVGIAGIESATGLDTNDSVAIRLLDYNLNEIIFKI